MADFKAPIEHALVRNTVQLRAGASANQLTSTGTGFLYQVAHPTTNRAKVLILTNKHVVRGAAVVRFVLSSAPSVSDLDDSHQPIGRTDHPIVLPLAGNVLPHPDPDIDLCGIDITIPYGQLLQSGRQLRSMNLTSEKKGSGSIDRRKSEKGSDPFTNVTPNDQLFELINEKERHFYSLFTPDHACRVCGPSAKSGDIAAV